MKEITQEERTRADNFNSEVYNSDRKLFDEAMSLLLDLGLGGLWSGRDVALMNIIETLQKVRAEALASAKKKNSQ